MDKSSRILITGGTGLVGTALLRILQENGFSNVINVGKADCNLMDDHAVRQLFADILPEYVFHLAARVHGIGGNQKYKSDVLYENVLINTNVIENARCSNVKKIVAMGSGCVYPELPGVEELSEDHIWLGPPHPSEDSYAHAKRLMLAHLIAAKEQYGLESAFAISGNIYGPHDNFDIDEGHVIPALVAKFHEAKQAGLPVKVWGSGIAIRDFSYCDDIASALQFLMVHFEGPVNIGSNHRHPISDIVTNLAAICGGIQVQWDTSKPDGQLKRFYNLNKLEASGFKAKITLEEGLKRTYNWYAEKYPNIRGSYGNIND